MRRLHLVTAAVATCIVLIVVAAGFMAIRVMQSAALPGAVNHPIHFRIAWTQAFNWLTALSVIAGITGWVILRAVHRDGVHRLAKLNTIAPKP